MSLKFFIGDKGTVDNLTNVKALLFFLVVSGGVLVVVVRRETHISDTVFGFLKKRAVRRKKDLRRSVKNRRATQYAPRSASML